MEMFASKITKISHIFAISKSYHNVLMTISNCSYQINIDQYKYYDATIQKASSYWHEMLVCKEERLKVVQYAPDSLSKCWTFHFSLGSAIAYV